MFGVFVRSDILAFKLLEREQLRFGVISMTDDEAEVKRLELVEVLAKTAQLLFKYNEKHWSVFLEESRGLVENRDFHGVERVFGSYGGMGSFNDILIHPINGHLLEESETSSVNKEFQLLKSDIWDRVRDLRRYKYAD